MHNTSKHLLADAIKANLSPAVKRRGGEVSVIKKFEAKARAWAKPTELLKNSHRIILGDAREMPGLSAAAPLHLVVTSPPYWDLKEYGDDHDGAQLGHIHDESAFHTELGRVWKNCYDRLVPGGRMCVVVGDVCRSRKAYGRHVVEPLHARILLECQRIGFDPLAPIIWSKIANAVTEVEGNGAPFLGKPYEPNAIIKNDIEYILLFRKPGGYRHPSQLQRDMSMIDKTDHARWFQQIWTDVPGEVQRHHPAPFPKEIALRLIGMFSFVGDMVLDPFWGTGNTTLAAMEMHRSSIGFEIEPAYFERAKTRFATVPFNSTIEFVARPGKP
ncbi:MAG: Methyltransferase [Phycisphaerales bacterium]|nr:Methyltransferase [Phycisphaerales bacterium]